MLAKLISGKHKPNKQTLLPCFAIEDLLADLDLRQLNGFGGKLGDKLIEQGIRKVGELRRYSMRELEALAGSRGHTSVVQWMYNACRGICTEIVKPRLLPKSIGCSKTFRGPEALTTLPAVEKFLGLQAKEIAERVGTHRKLHNKYPTKMTIFWTTSIKDVRRKGKSLTLPGGGASRCVTFAHLRRCSYRKGCNDSFGGCRCGISRRMENHKHGNFGRKLH